jgi:two-component system, LytTR family, response regulator
MNYPNLAFNTGKEIKFFAQEEVMYCTSDDNYTDLFTSDSKKISTSKSLKELEQIFTPDLFVRVHNSCIINLMFVASFSHNADNVLVMADGKRIVVSRRKRPILLSKFFKL